MKNLLIRVGLRCFTSFSMTTVGLFAQHPHTDSKLFAFCILGTYIVDALNVVYRSIR
jgi:hypothetical protein